MIGKDIVIKGEIRGEEDIHIEGTVEGKVISTREVIIGEHGNVTAEIQADTIVVKGKLTGNVTAKSLFQLVPSGVMKGDIKSPKINIAEGSTFQGKIDMTPTTT